MSAQPTITAVSFEQHASGRGIGIASPRISWKFTADSNTIQNWEQTGYDIEICRELVSESYHTESANSLLVPWPSQPLHSREVLQVRVRSYGGSIPEPTEWSEWNTLECGLLHRQDWNAQAITSPVKQKDGPLRPLRFRKTFHAASAASSAGMKRARLYITSLGVFQAYINGSPVGDHFLAPGWTSYHHRLNYEVFDIAPLLREGENVIAVEVAEGWYATRLGFLGGRRFIYGDKMALIAQLEIESEGTEQVILSDSSWKSHTSALISSEIYDGEVYDAREEEDWTNHTFNAASWSGVCEIEFPQTELVAPNAPPVRVTQTIKPVQIITTPSGKTIVDFGQNLVGRVRIPSLLTPQDTTITLTHAEVLENNELGTRPLRIAKCTDTIISSGEELNWTPRFTFHGFRYVQIDNWTPTLTNLLAEVLHTDLVRTGWFKSSHEMINKLHENATWSMRGNFLSIPTDCPQRDERLGWTGDIQIFGPSASFLYNTAGMLGDWLKDLSAEQLATKDAIPPFVVPSVISESLWPIFPQAVWDDVAILLPWTLYQSYGDKEILARQYPSMTAWLDRGIRRGQDGLWDDQLFQLGDWLDPTAPPDQPGNSRTDGTLVADAYLVHVTKVLASIGRILGQGENVSRYERDYLKHKARFQEKYVSAEGYLVGDTQTALALVIFFDLLDSEAQIANAGARLARLVKKARFQVSTGFAGTPIITHALCKVGYVQLAYRMLLEKNCPSWMYPITMGATTIWERWDSMRPDGSINPGEMTSFNHYALGSIVNWLHKDVAGVSLLEPGWKRIIVKPLPGGTVTSAEVRYETAFGKLECRWVLEGTLFKLSLVVPPNSSADVVLPGEDVAKRIGSGRYEFETRFESGVGWPPKPLGPPMWDFEDSFV